MRQNLFYRPLALVAGLLSAAALWPSPLWAADPDDKVDTKEADTPQALLATYRAAHAAKDWRKCFLCYDEKMRANTFCCMLTGVADSNDEQAKEIVLKPLAGKFDDVDKREHSHHPEPLGSRDLRIYKMFQKQADLPGLVAAAYRHTEATNRRGTPPNFGNAWDIRSDGNTAVASWRPEPVRLAGAEGRPGQLYVPRVQQIDFCRLDGQWYLTVPPVPAPLTIRERAAKLLAEIDSLRIELSFATRDVYAKGSDEPLPDNHCRQVTLSVEPLSQSSDSTVRVAQLTKEQARQLIERLATEGFLRDAAELDKQEMPDTDPAQNSFALQVSTKNLSLHEALGGGQPALKRLDGLRGELDGKAAQALDAVLAGYADEGKAWEAASAARKPTAPAGNKPAAPGR